MSTVGLRMRRRVEVNTDPQRRCYNGCHFSSELRWTEWTVIDSGLTPEQAERRLTYWRDLNAYAVKERGEANTRCEFATVPEQETV